jgi:hypothetical protein
MREYASSIPKRIDVPTGLVLEQLCRWSMSINPDRPARHTIFDLAKVEHVPPFGMLFTAACIRRYKRSAFAQFYPTAGGLSPKSTAAMLSEIATDGHPTCRCVCNARNHYASHMGFWQSLGETLGKSPGEASGSSRYLPVTRVRRTEVVAAATQRHREPGDIIYDDADRLAEILCQQAGNSLENTLSYSIRELFRNVWEHSGSHDLWYAAQYWPTKEYVEIAVLDEGVGVMTSLRENPENRVDNELQAIVMATRRGVSGSKPRPTLRTVSGEAAESRWINSGWGLFVLRELARKAGSLLIVSNNSVVLFVDDSVRSFDCSFAGTAVRLVLRPSKLKDLLQTILRDSTADVPPSRLTPSMLARIRNSHF